MAPPTPTNSGISTMSNPFIHDDRFDGLYLQVADTTRGIEPLLDTVFSFLRRKTDFLNGPPGSGDNGTEIAVQKVNEVLQRHVDLYLKEKNKGKKKRAPTKTATPPKKPTRVPTKQHEPRKKPTRASSKPHEPKKKQQDDDDVIEMSTDGGFDISSATTTANSSPSNEQQQEEETAKKEPPPPTAAATASTDDSSSPSASQTENKKEEELTTAATTTATATATAAATTAASTDSSSSETETKKEQVEDAAGKTPPPIGNGGTVDGKYVWTQTLSEVNVNIPVPENTRGRDLNVVITRNHFKVKLRKSTTGEPILDAPLCKSVVVDDSFWTVEDGNRLCVNFQKVNQMEWWDCVCQGDAAIDIKAIQPESSSLSDLDGETRKTVEKMMFDQKQKALGLPTSEEQNKLDMLEKFKQQHPELDFSNAKIS